MKSTVPHAVLVSAAIALAGTAVAQTTTVGGTGWVGSSTVSETANTLSGLTVRAASTGRPLNTLSGSATLASNAFYTAVPSIYNDATFGGDLWIGFTGGRTTGALSSSDSANFKLTQGTDLDSGMVLRIGSISGSDVWDASGGAASGSNDPGQSAISMTSGDRLSFVLIHVDYTADGNDTASVWIFDSQANAPTDATGLGAATFTLTGDFAFDTLGLYAAANSTFAFDTIRLTDNYLTAVPEPAAYAALLGVGTLGLVVYRRRRARR